MHTCYCFEGQGIVSGLLDSNFQDWASARNTKAIHASRAAKARQVACRGLAYLQNIPVTLELEKERSDCNAHQTL
jgi:hypothetical protein